MKRITLRLAGAVLALAICFGASARAHAPASYAPVASHVDTKMAAPAFTSAILVVAVVYVVYRAVTQAYSAHPLNHVDPVAQFDNTK
jgi:hypothetical protein